MLVSSYNQESIRILRFRTYATSRCTKEQKTIMSFVHCPFRESTKIMCYLRGQGCVGTLNQHVMSPVEDSSVTNRKVQAFDITHTTSRCTKEQKTIMSFVHCPFRESTKIMCYLRGQGCVGTLNQHVMSAVEDSSVTNRKVQAFDM
uniref:SUEL-type lectin domain-containing protein n=1 Tax=Steinernema glaseri TaxID=37863 RepID=A0A1I7ZD31_9BILA